MSGRLTRLSVLAAILAVPGAALEARQAEGRPMSASASYRVGPGDVLEVTVRGREDLSRSLTVKTSGIVSMALVGDVAVAELTTREIQRKLENLLAGDFLEAPEIVVAVAEYWSKFASVAGEVNRPGRKALRGRTRLVDLLIEAGGFSPRASGEVVIDRREGAFEDGSHTLKLQLGRSPTLRDQVNLSVLLEPGDVITATPQYHVRVQGEVVSPGDLAMVGELRLSRAIALAGGVTRFASERASVRRSDPTVDDEVTLEVDLKAIRRGEQTDPVLLPYDVVTVESRRF
jgi:polysaccharide export outer membrane protein